MWVTQHDKFWVKLCVIVMWNQWNVLLPNVFNIFKKNVKSNDGSFFIIIWNYPRFIFASTRMKIFFFPLKLFLNGHLWPSIIYSFQFVLDIVFLKWFICMSFIHHQNCMVNGAQHLNASLHKLAILKFVWN
jgi:hypothetical protein